MQASIECAARRLCSFITLAASIVIYFLLSSYVFGGENSRSDSLLATRAFLVGTTPRIREIVSRTPAPHRTRLTNHKINAEFGTPPAPCGVEMFRTFSTYCIKRLNIQMTPCYVSDTHVNCSTDYFPPRDKKVFWRLYYTHTTSEASLELQAVQRDKSGRLSAVIGGKAEEFEKLYDVLLRTSRCR